MRYQYVASVFAWLFCATAFAQPRALRMEASVCQARTLASTILDANAGETLDVQMRGQNGSIFAHVTFRRGSFFVERDLSSPRCNSLQRAISVMVQLARQDVVQQEQSAAPTQPETQTARATPQAQAPTETTIEERVETTTTEAPATATTTTSNDDSASSTHVAFVTSAAIAWGWRTPRAGPEAHIALGAQIDRVRFGVSTFVPWFKHNETFVDGLTLQSTLYGGGLWALFDVAQWPLTQMHVRVGASIELGDARASSSGTRARTPTTTHAFWVAPKALLSLEFGDHIVGGFVRGALGYAIVQPSFTLDGIGQVIEFPGITGDISAGVFLRLP